MKNLKTVGIRELKNNLSAYIREVQAGWRILVTDRDKVVAELGEPFGTLPEAENNPLLAQWIREGKVRPPLAKKGSWKYPLSPVRAPAGTAQRLIDEDRGE